MIWVFIGSILRAFHYIRFSNEAIIIIGLAVAGIANTYIVRGPIAGSYFAMWALLIGWLNPIRYKLND